MTARPALPGLSLALALAAMLSGAPAHAQDEAGGTVSAADADKGMEARPASVKVGHSSLGDVLTDAQGRTLYAMDAGVVRARYGASYGYCHDACAQKWTALAAPKDAAPIGHWKVVTGAVGPQWAWNNNLVFTYAADAAPGSVAGNGYDDLWTVIAYVPPVPTLVAPAAVSIVYADGAYRMTDDAGHPLFTGHCAQDCAAWQPLGAGQASRAVGEWKPVRDGDRAHWLFRGQPVYVAADDTPPGATLLKP